MRNFINQELCQPLLLQPANPFRTNWTTQCTSKSLATQVGRQYPAYKETCKGTLKKDNIDEDIRYRRKTRCMYPKESDSNENPNKGEDPIKQLLVKKDTK